MVVPFTSRTKKPMTHTSEAGNAMLLLETLNRKYILIPLTETRIESRGDELIIRGKVYEGGGRYDET